MSNSLCVVQILHNGTTETIWQVQSFAEVTTIDDAVRLITGLRPEVLAFAKLMEVKLRKHDADWGKHGWKDATIGTLLDRLAVEESELREVCYPVPMKKRNSPENVTRIAEEAADVANFAMMIADVVGGLK